MQPVISLIDPKNAESMRLLRRVYDDVYIPAFPDIRERDSLELWEEFLPDGNLFIFAVTIDDTPKAIAVSYYNPPANSGELSYIAIKPEARGGGLARKLTDMRIDALMKRAQDFGHNAPAGIFLEVHNPSKISANDDVMDPAKHLLLYTRRGARIINIPYVQASEPGIEPARNLLLLSWPVNGAHASRDAIAAFVVEKFRDYGCADPYADPDVKAILGRLSQDTDIYK